MLPVNPLFGADFYSPLVIGINFITAGQKLPKDKEKTLQSWETLVADDFMRKRRKSTDVKQDSPEK